MKLSEKRIQQLDEKCRMKLGISFEELYKQLNIQLQIREEKQKALKLSKKEKKLIKKQNKHKRI